MSEMKTKPTDAAVDAFLDEVGDPARRDECRTILELMREVTGAEPKMWVGGMVGFGSYHYRYESGREGDWFVTGFSPRKANLTLYIMAGFDRYEVLLERLGKFKTGKSCLYLKRLSDVDIDVLEELVRESVAHVSGTYERRE
jgi:hypothetical protein